MFRTPKFALAALTAVAIASTAFAGGHSDPIANAIKARQSVMQLYQFNLGVLGAMAQGGAEYDADAASAAAGNLVALASVNQSAMWPVGSDMDSVDGTKARAEIWANFPDVGAKGAAMAEAAAAMQAAAGTDLDALKAAMGPLGGACGGCHQSYRAR